MTATLIEPPTAPSTEQRIVGPRCRSCGRVDSGALAYVCASCFGPLDIAYDFHAIDVTRQQIEARPPGIWRYGELLPLDSTAPGTAPGRSLAVGSTPLVDATRLADALGIGQLWVKDDTRNPSLSFKDRAVAVAAARASDLGLQVLACASTGNLAAATAAAAAARGIPSLVVVPADLEPEKSEHALAYGASVLPVDGTYDDVNRLCLELADETGWGFVNVNLRPYYAEGSKTLAFEVAEALGWRLPDVIVAPIASGALFTKLARGFRQLAAVGLLDGGSVRFVGAQAEGCAPVAEAFARGGGVRPVRQPDTIVRSLAIGSPADGEDALALALESGGSIEAVPDSDTAESIRLLATSEGIYAETAAGVTVSAAAAARRRGVIRDSDEVVVLVTGNGFKTPDARRFGLRTRRVAPGEPGLAETVAPNIDAVLDQLAATLPTATPTGATS